MPAIDPDYFDAQRGLPDYQYSSDELARMFGGDDGDDDLFPQDQDLRQNYKAALQWWERGYNVVPQKVIDKKHPRVKWKELQKRLVTRDELLDWYSLFANGVGFITGEISGVIVVETDGPEGEALLDEFARLHGPLPETLTIRSGSGRGLHRHFKHPGHKVKTKPNKAIKVDIKGDGGFCVLPPSGHKSGGHYEVVHDVEPAPLPEGLLEFIEVKARKAKAPANGSQENKKDKETGPSPIYDAGHIFDEVPEYIRNSGLTPNISSSEVDRPQPPIEVMRQILEHLNTRNYFANRDGVEKDMAGRIVEVGWRECGMALKAAYGEVGFGLWAITHEDDRARNDAPGQWASFASEARPGHVTIATLIKAAKDAGFVMPGLADGVGAEVLVTDEDARWDIKNGRLFADMFRGKLLFIHETGDVLTFDEVSGWVHAEPGEVDRAAKEVVKILRDQAADEWKKNHEDPKAKRLIKHVDYSSKSANLRAMIDMAKSEPGMMVRLNDFDNDPMLLGATNGVLDLARGMLLPVSPEVLVSKRCSVVFDPIAACPRFLKYLAEIQPDVNVRDFLQRFFGYCLTGRVNEHMFLFLYGHGANGKSVFVELMNWLLGDYANKIQTEMLMKHQRNPQGASPEIVALKGLRFVYANETSEGGRLDEARIKDLTGGDTLTGRVLYGKVPVTFAPSHKLVMVGNHKPEINDTSHGMWRRVGLVQFEETIPKPRRDPSLLKKLKAEGSGILNWMLTGLQQYQKNGLQIPEKIKAATAAYREEQDIIGEWIRENCNTGAGCSEKKGILYDDYQRWAKENGHGVFSKTKLTRRLNERGCKVAADNRTVHGIALKRAGAHGLGRNI